MNRPSPHVLESLAPELYTWEAKYLGESLVCDENHLWLLVEGDGRRHRLGYLLGRSLANVSEVTLIPKTEGKPDRYLTRLGQTYKLDELPRRTLSEATAAELVLSLWIRRRDAHPYNRAYTSDGTPVFFDFGVAFGGEPWLDAGRFFSPRGPGQAGSWRVRELPVRRSRPLTTIESRQHHWWEGTHFVESRTAFVDAVHACVKDVLRLAEDLQALAETAGFSAEAAGKIATRLDADRRALPDEVAVMLGVVFRE